MAHDKTALQTAREAVSAASGRRMIAVSCDTGDDQSVPDMVLAVTDGLAEVRRAIAGRQALPGERLPPARNLPAVLGMDRNTVLRALRLLCDEGLLGFRAATASPWPGTPQRGAVLTQARELGAVTR